MSLTPQQYAHLYKLLGRPISRRQDCGRHCAPLNGGEPVCCTTRHAIPVVERGEWNLLRSRTKMWRHFRPYDAASRKIKEELASTCLAIECRGAAFCERDNRSLACRTFPFFPYFTREREWRGFSYYWTFEDRCWVISWLQEVDAVFVGELFAAYEYLFQCDETEREPFVELSASMRRVFSRQRRPIPLLQKGKKWSKVLPASGGRIVAAKETEFKRHGPYRSETAYRQAAREADELYR